MIDATREMLEQDLRSIVGFNDEFAEAASLILINRGWAKRPATAVVSEREKLVEGLKLAPAGTVERLQKDIQSCSMRDNSYALADWLGAHGWRKHRALAPEPATTHPIGCVCVECENAHMRSATLAPEPSSDDGTWKPEEMTIKAIRARHEYQSYPAARDVGILGEAIDGLEAKLARWREVVENVMDTLRAHTYSEDKEKSREVTIRLQDSRNTRIFAAYWTLKEALAAAMDADDEATPEAK